MVSNYYFSCFDGKYPFNCGTTAMLCNYGLVAHSCSTIAYNCGSTKLWRLHWVDTVNSSFLLFPVLKQIQETLVMRITRESVHLMI